MKLLRISMLTLAVMAASVMSGAAAVGPINGDAGLRDNSYYDTLGKDYDVDIQFNTNNPPQLLLVVGLPVLSKTDLISEIRGTVGTDAAGKIDGAQYATIYWNGLSHQADFTTFNIDVSGSIGSRGIAPFVRINMKGIGYDFGSASNYTADAVLNLNFISSGLLRSVSNLVEVSSGTNTADAINFFSELPGTVSGTIKRGAKAQPIKLIREPAVLRTANAGHDNEGIIVGTTTNDTGQVLATFIPYNVGMEIVSITHFDARVVQPSTRFSLTGSFFGERDDIAGRGVVDKLGGVHASLRGIAHRRGPKLKMIGRTGDLIVDHVDGNPVVVRGAIKNNVEISGKLFGQTLNLRGGTGQDVPE